MLWSGLVVRRRKAARREGLPLYLSQGRTREERRSWWKLRRARNSEDGVEEGRRSPSKRVEVDRSFEVVTYVDASVPQGVLLLRTPGKADAACEANVFRRRLESFVVPTARPVALEPIRKYVCQHVRFSRD